MSKLLTSSQAAKILKVTQSRVRQLCRAGMINGATLFGRDWLIPAESLAEAKERPGPGRPKTSEK